MHHPIHCNVNTNLTDQNENMIFNHTRNGLLSPFTNLKPKPRGAVTLALVPRNSNSDMMMMRGRPYVIRVFTTIKPKHATTTAQNNIQKKNRAQWKDVEGGSSLMGEMKKDKATMIYNHKHPHQSHYNSYHQGKACVSRAINQGVPYI